MTDTLNTPAPGMAPTTPVRKSRLNRDLQLSLLNLLADIHPKAVHLVPDSLGCSEAELRSTRSYLVDHGLITKIDEDTPYGRHSLGFRITGAGMDFLEDDGGLSAILGVVTVRLHDDTIKSLVAEKISASNLPEPEKKRYLDHLRELPGEATKHLVMKLVDLGLDQGPKALEAIVKLLAQA